MRPLPALLCLLAAGCSESGPYASRASAQIVSGSYGGHGYRLFIPSGYRSSQPAPLVLMLHGCLQGAADFAAATRMDEAAEAGTFLAVYPEQQPAINPARCWVWWERAHQERGGGHPAFFAGLVAHVAASYTLDPRRIFVAGFSSGGAMASILGAAYPDVFAALLINSGMEYRAASALAESFPAMAAGGPPPAQQGRLAFQAMGPRARVVPVLAFHGTADSIVRPINGEQVVAQWAQTNDLADNGADDESIRESGEQRRGQVPSGWSFVHTRYRDLMGAVVMERYTIEGMNHAWSGGGSGPYADPRGPSASALGWAFFQAHPMGGPGPAPDGGADGGDGGAGDLGADLGAGARFSSIAAEDGYAGALLVDGASTAEHKVGDRGLFSRDTYRLILSFDTSGLPDDATIRGAHLRLVRRSLVGTVSGLSLDIRSGVFGAGAALAQEDHAAAASQSGIATAAVPSADGSAVEIPLPAEALVHISRTGRTQLRLRASTTPGFAPNLLVVHGGEDGAQAPELLVEY